MSTQAVLGLVLPNPGSFGVCPLRRFWDSFFPTQEVSGYVHSGGFGTRSSQPRKFWGMSTQAVLGLVLPNPGSLGVCPLQVLFLEDMLSVTQAPTRRSRSARPRLLRVPVSASSRVPPTGTRQVESFRASASELPVVGRCKNYRRQRQGKQTAKSRVVGSRIKGFLPTVIQGNPPLY